MNVLLRTGDRRVEGTVRVCAHYAVGTACRIDLVLGYCTEGNGVPDFRIQIVPLHGVAGVNGDRAVNEAHQGKRLLSAGRGGDLADTCGHGCGSRRNLGGEHVRDRVVMLCMLLLEVRVCEVRPATAAWPVCRSMPDRAAGAGLYQEREWYRTSARVLGRRFHSSPPSGRSPDKSGPMSKARWKHKKSHRRVIRWA